MTGWDWSEPQTRSESHGRDTHIYIISMWFKPSRYALTFCGWWPPLHGHVLITPQWANICIMQHYLHILRGWSNQKPAFRYCSGIVCKHKRQPTYMSIKPSQKFQLSLDDRVDHMQTVSHRPFFFFFLTLSGEISADVVKIRCQLYVLFCICMQQFTVQAVVLAESYSCNSINSKSLQSDLSS